MTNMLETLKRPPDNKKRITITLSQDTYDLLEKELKHAKSLRIGWNRSNLVDAILYYELTHLIEIKV